MIFESFNHVITKYLAANPELKNKIINDTYSRMDRMIRYLYIRNNRTGAYWFYPLDPSAADPEAPVCEYKYGIGYTKMGSTHESIRIETICYTPLHQPYEVWGVSLENLSDRLRGLTITGYADDKSQIHTTGSAPGYPFQEPYFADTSFAENFLLQNLHPVSNVMLPESAASSPGGIKRFFGLCGAAVSSFCGNKANFFQEDRSHKNPLGVELGNLGDEQACSKHSCSALSSVIILAPHEERMLCFLAGSNPDIISGLKKYEDCIQTIEREITELTEHWMQSIQTQIH